MRYIFLITFLLYTLNAQNITVSSEQEKSWEIKTMKPETSSLLPLGEFIAEVKAPPSSIWGISLPFEANIQQLNIAKYQEVKKGDVLAKVTGSAWINAQQEAINNAIALKEQQNTTIRKRVLCKEGIIPQKECIASEMQLDILKTKADATRALLESYGAMPGVITKLLNTLKLSSTLDIISPDDGTVKVLNAIPGKTVLPSEAHFVIQKNDKLWLESRIETRFAGMLEDGQPVKISLRDKVFTTKVLQVASIIEPESQTQLVRFDVPLGLSLHAGTRATAFITLKQSVLKVPKSAVINFDGKKILFIKKEKSYTPLTVKILGEDTTDYYIPDESKYHFPIAVTSLAILKNLIGDEDE